MGAALQIWSATFSDSFEGLAVGIRDAAQRKIDDMGPRPGDFPHRRLQGRSEFKLRVSDYRGLYEFDLKLGRIYLHYIGHRREIYKKG